VHEEVHELGDQATVGLGELGVGHAPSYRILKARRMDNPVDDFAAWRFVAATRVPMPT
jgi:hypothetical protein